MRKADCTDTVVLITIALSYSGSSHPVDHTGIRTNAKTQEYSDLQGETRNGPGKLSPLSHPFQVTDIFGAPVNGGEYFTIVDVTG